MEHYSFKIKHFEKNQVHYGLQMKYYFINGYAASVIMHDSSDGGMQGYFQIHLMNHANNLINNENFPKSIGHLTFGEIDDQLTIIANLNPIEF
jgi:hypothetical protein